MEEKIVDETVKALQDEEEVKELQQIDGMFLFVDDGVSGEETPEADESMVEDIEEVVEEDDESEDTTIETIADEAAIEDATIIEDEVAVEEIEEVAVDETVEMVETVETSAEEISVEEETKFAPVIDEPYQGVSDETAIIANGMVINGDVVSDGNIELIGTINGNVEILGKFSVAGKVNGNIKANDMFVDGAELVGNIEAEDSVKVGNGSVIIGNITANAAIIAGAVKGDIDVHGPVILDSTAIIMGNIKSMAVQINNGAVIEGMCSQCYADVNPTDFFNEFKKSSE